MATDGASFCILPEDCTARVFSLTSPVGACRLSAVCTTFCSVAVSDTVWDRFLPPDYQSILSRAVHPVEYSSKKELFFRLCDPILIDDGNMSFSLDKSSGAKCYMLSARRMFILWGDTPEHWSWHPLPDSRFSEVAVLLSAWWLEIRGNFESRMLTPKTTYAAYLIYKTVQNSEGLGFPNQETTVKLGAQVSNHTVNLEPDAAKRHMNRNETAARAPQARADGWMEMEIGEFYNDEGDDGEVEMSLMEVMVGLPKVGLIIQGIEIMPKK